MSETTSKKRAVLGVHSLEKALKDVAWVAAFLNVSRSWVYQATSSGALSCLRIGAAVPRFDPEVIRKWVRGETSALSVKLPSCR